jgi:hypothetical protein
LLTKQQVIIKALAAKAAKGDTRAISKVVDLMLTLFGVDGEQSTAGRLADSDEALLAEFLAQGRANGNDAGE